MPVPVWVSCAVAPHRPSAVSWIRQIRPRSAKVGPSGNRSRVNTPGKSGSFAGPGAPAAARDWNTDQPVATPTWNHSRSASQRSAGRPRTGTSTAAISGPLTANHTSAWDQRLEAIEIRTGAASSTHTPAVIGVTPSTQPACSRWASR